MTASPLLAPAPTGRVRPSPPPRGEGSSRPRDSSGTPHGEYRPDIDGLRAVAVLAVVAYHTKAWVLPGGFVGVDVFFVISGFLISGIILQRLQKGTFSIADFYARRIRRIFPALSLVLVTCLAVGWFVLLPGELADLGGDVAAGAGFVSNIRFWTQTNYFGPDVDSKPLLHLWSLGIEEQYYLLWPFVLAFLWRGSHRVAPMVGLMVVSFAISLTLSFTDARSAFYLPVTRLWELLLGSLVAYAVFAHGDPARLVLRLTTRGGGDADAMRIAHTRDAMAWIGLSLIALALALLRTTSVFPGAWALLPTVGTALLISAGPKAWVNRTILSHPAVVGIGLISYPLYLWHWPVLALIRIHYPDVSYVAKGGALLGAFVAAYLTYRVLERWVRHTSGTRIVVALCTVQAMLLAAGLVLVWKAGFPARGDAVHRRIYAVDIHATDADATPSDTIAGLCMIMWDERAFDPRCYTPPSGANPPQHVVLWGDSFAAHWRPGLKRILGDSTTISQMTSAGCAPILDYVEAARPNCAALNRFALARIAESHPDVVVLSGRWSSYPAYPQVAKTLDALRALGIPRVILIGSSAQYHQPVPRLLLMALSSGAAPTRMHTRMMPKLREVDSTLRAVAARGGASFIAPLDAQCTALGCLVALDTGAVGITTRDDGHLTPAGAIHIAERLFTPVLRP